MKEKVFKEEMKGFNISIDDIEPSNDIFGAIEKAIIKMRNDYLIDRLEVILNDNLIECKDKLTNFKTILGCRISYDNLPKDVSFIVRKDEKPTYEKLEEEINRLNNIIDEMEKDLEVVFDKMKEKQVEIDGRGYYYTDLIPIENILDKIKELKENNE